MPGRASYLRCRTRDRETSCDPLGTRTSSGSSVLAAVDARRKDHYQSWIWAETLRLRLAVSKLDETEPRRLIPPWLLLSAT
ncbi:hypothetical protein BV22DRAFT_1030947 [Leucogyrophana mollusca]|uniref:Uncharacterized protein n=1 Tax=Leucogyrophana mollusca TaxID=85980 RepID=A0ACB8BUK4_9AGAM|nr:hypothetical protein BV22DRAFT_1030947 [Leucogyrophana mollusca]